MPMQNKEIQNALKRIESAEKILILISSPDGDSIGTSIVLKHLLESKQKYVSLYSNKPINNSLKRLPLIEEIEITNVVKLDFYNYDLLITIDTANLEQLYNYNIYKNFKFPDNLDILYIDHHFSNTNFGKYKLYEQVSSTAEVLFKYLIENKYDLSLDEAELLYYAIAYDTGFFRWQLNPYTFHAASELLKKELDYDKLSNIYFENIDDKFANILDILVKRTKFHKKLKYTSLYIDEKLIKKMNIDRENLKNYLDTYRANFLMNLTNYDISVIIREAKGFNIISFRGKSYTNKINLTEINKYSDFKGGGHKNACSFSSEKNYKEILQEINTALKDLKSKV